MFITFSGTFALLGIVYTGTIIYMLCILNKLPEGGLKTQTSSVKIQFLVFFAGFLIKIIYYIWGIFYEKAGNGSQSYFYGIFVGWLLCPAWNTIPITYVLYRHH